MLREKCNKREGHKIKKKKKKEEEKKKAPIRYYEDQWLKRTDSLRSGTAGQVNGQTWYYILHGNASERSSVNKQKIHIEIYLNPFKCLRHSLA